MDGVEILLWLRDEGRYVAVGSLPVGPEHEAWASVVVTEDVERYVGDDGRVHVYVRSAGPFGAGPRLPELSLDGLRVIVQARPEP